jgi:toxin CptA
MIWLWLAAALLAFVAGFALHRGGICAVAAMREVVEERRWRRFVSFFECAAWSLMVLLAASASGLMSIGTWPAQMSMGVALAGGALFGVGALINGACAFGSASRLASGELSFLALIPGFVLGAVLTLQVGFGASIAMSSVEAPLIAIAGAGLALAVFALWRMWTAVRAAPTPARAAETLRAAHWPPALAMALMGVANVGLLLVLLNWPYTSLLVDVSVGRGMSYDVRAGLVAVFLIGAWAGAATAGRFRFRGAGWSDLAQRFGGGVLMGVGGVMIPGGNDALVLVGLPLLQPTALAAYAGMIAVLAAGFQLRNLMRRRAGKLSSAAERR